MDEPINILCVDDRPQNLLALEAVLENLNINIVKAASGQEALEFILQKEFALVLMDVQMPDMDGFETASLIRGNKRTEKIPIIFVTAISFEQKHVFKGYDSGAVDYLFKPIDPNILRSKVIVFIELFEQKQKAKKKALELQQANQRILSQQKALQQNEVRFRTAFNQSFQFMAILDIEGRVIEINDLACRLCGGDEAGILGAYLWDAWQFGNKREKEALKKSIKEAADNNFSSDEAVIYDPGGHMTPILRTVSPVKDESGSVVYITVQGQDISERKQAEEEKLRLETQLRQSQKMEALGTLAGGIAHDFNNILSVILGYADMARKDTDKSSRPYKHLSKISAAANKAKDLVHQILGFSRQTEVERVIFNPALIIQEAAKLIKASLPSTIDIKLDIDPKCGSIMADPTQFHQILINLCTNASHAMEPDGGSMVLGLQEIYLDHGDLPMETDLRPGKFAMLSVRDTGCGMDDETMERIFDPYFTTKAVGKGTGMGLSIVHGIVKNHSGLIRVESEYGSGSVFYVYFPVSDENAVPETHNYYDPVSSGHERILLVEDDKEILEMVQIMIESLGYRVTPVMNSRDAWEMFKSNPEKFDLAMTDLTMPGMSGTDLARRILDTRPDFPVVLYTGYSQHHTKESVREIGLKDLLFKPLTADDISRSFRRILDNKAARK